jgi:dihydrofolate reductase
MPPLAMIVAIAQNGVIGRGGGLPWNYPEDRAHFARATAGHAVIMGRRTWEEVGEPLAGRHNIVLSRTIAVPSGVWRVSTFDEALTVAWSLDPEPFVIGGARVFEAAWPRITHAFVTEIPESPEGDVVYRFDPTGLELVSERAGKRGERYCEYRRAEV